MKRIVVALLTMILLIACRNETKERSPKLLFKSGFEKGVYIDSEPVEGNGDFDYIRGKDSESGFSWPIEVLGSSQSALHRISEGKDKALYSTIETVENYEGKPTRAIYNHESSRPAGDTQLAYEILNITKGKQDLYVKYMMKIDSGMIGKPNKWRALFEYKTKDYKDPDENGTGYRLIAFVYTNAEGKPSWHLQGDKDSEHPVWECDTLELSDECNNESVPVVTDEWFQVEYFWHWSDGDDGYTSWRVNGKIVGEHHGATTRGGNPIDFIILTQLYGDVTPKYQWIDDIEIWDGIPR